MRYGFLNNFQQTLAAALGEGATTLSLNDGGAQLADASTDYRYKLTLIQRDAFGTETHREIVDVTAASGNDLTIEGAKEGTTRLAGGWPSGTAVEARVTAEVMGSLAPEVMAFGPLDLSDGGASASLQMPAGMKLFVDSLDLVPLDTATGGFALTQSGSPVLPNSARAIRFSPDGTMMAVGHYGSPYLSIVSTSDWSLISPHPSSALFSTNGVEALAWSADGAYLACGQSDSGNLVVLDTSDWSQVTVSETIPEPVVRADFSPDGAYLALAFADATTGLMVLDVATWTAVSLTAVVDDFAYDVKFSHDSTLLAVAHEGTNNISIIEVATWDNVAGAPSITDATSSRALAWAPDDSLLMVARSAATDDRLVAFDTSDWSTVAVSATYLTGAITALDYIDATQFVATDGNSDFWVINTADYSQAFTAVCGNFGADDVHVDDVGGYVGVAAGGGDYVYVFGETAFSASINAGTSAGDNQSLLAAAAVSAPTQHSRQTFAIDAAPGVSAVYVEPATAANAAANAMLVVRGYLMEL